MNKNELLLKEIFIYPVKGLAPVALTKSKLTRTGLLNDRHWMLVTNDGQFISQRQFPILSQFNIEINDTQVQIAFGRHSIVWTIDQPATNYLSATIWKDTLNVESFSPEINAWFSHHLNADVSLVRQIKGESQREKLIPKMNDSIPLSFVDGYPIHLINEASLMDLSSRIGQSISPLRFRPNLIFSNINPYEEENIDRISTDQWSMNLIKPTVRCQVPNIDPVDGSQSAQPISELSKYKRHENKIEFGMYATISTEGEIELNQRISCKYVD